jgi:hypothetical protein
VTPSELDGWSYADLSRLLIEHHYPDVDLDTTGHRPDWLGNYDTPGEADLEAEIERLEDELSKARAYKDLLWEQDDTLENEVYEAFRDAGLDVEGEVPDRRDGALNLPDRIIMLEITGTDGGISEQKLRQLKTRVDHNQADFDRTVTGLFVVNHFRDPTDRRVNIDSSREEYFEQDAIQVVTTTELFKMIQGLHSVTLTGDGIEEKLRTGEGIITFPEVEASF